MFGITAGTSCLFKWIIYRKRLSCDMFARDKLTESYYIWFKEL